MGDHKIHMHKQSLKEKLNAASASTDRHLWLWSITVLQTDASDGLDLVLISSRCHASHAEWSRAGSTNPAMSACLFFPRIDGFNWLPGARLGTFLNFQKAFRVRIMDSGNVFSLFIVINKISGDMCWDCYCTLIMIWSIYTLEVRLISNLQSLLMHIVSWS